MVSRLYAIEAEKSIYASVCYAIIGSDNGLSPPLWCQGIIRTNAGFSMMTSSNGNIFRETGPLCGEFTGPGEFPTQRPVTRSFDVLFDLRLNKRLSKQS